MMRTVWRAGFVCVVAGALAAGAVVLGVLEPRALEADEGARVRLLVKCEPEALPGVLAALAKTRAEVWDLKSMQRLSAVPPSPEPAMPPAPSRAKPGAVAPLRDAGRVMVEVYRAIGTISRPKLGPYFRLDEMAIQPRRVSLGLTADSGAGVDLVRQALATSPWLAARGVQVTVGAARRVGRHVQQKLYLKFDASRPEPGEAVHLAQLDAQAFERITRTHKLTYLHAGAVQQDPNRKAGYVTTAREYTFRSATLAQLQAFLAAVPAAQPGLVPFEVRWKLGPGGTIHKPVVRVGGRAPAP